MWGGGTDPRLKPRLFVRAELPIVPERDALVVPAEAIQRIAGEPYLFVATGREGEFALRKVQPGQTVQGGARASPPLPPRKRETGDEEPETTGEA
ncbi:MAG: hypothetical protein ACK4NB_06400 [Fimbriimonadales bacterium]